MPLSPTWKNPTTSEEGIKPTELPLEISQEQRKLARRQQLVNAIAQQSLQYRGDTQMVGNVAIKKSPWEALAQALTGGVAGYADNKLEERSAELPGKLAELNQAEMEKYAAAERDIGPDAANRMGLSSRSPIVQAMVQQKLKEEAKMRQMLGEKAAGNSTGASTVAAAQGGGIGALTSKAPELGEVGGIIIDREAGKPIAPFGPEGQFQVRTNKDGDEIGVQPQTGKQSTINNAPKMTMNATLNAGEKGNIKLAEKAAEGTWGAFQKGYENSQKAVKTYEALDRQEKALAEGARTGMLQPIGDVLAQVGAAVGMPVDQQKLASGAQYQSAFATEIADYLTSGGGVGRSLTDSDRKMLEKQYAQQWMTPQGQLAVIQDLKNRARDQVSMYQQHMSNMEKEFPDVAKMAKVSMPPGTLPQAGTAPAPGQPNVKSWKSF